MTGLAAEKKTDPKKTVGPELPSLTEGAPEAEVGEAESGSAAGVPLFVERSAPRTPPSATPKPPATPTGPPGAASTSPRSTPPMVAAKKEVGASEEISTYEVSPAAPLPRFVVPALDAGVSSLPEEILPSPVSEPETRTKLEPVDARAEIASLLDQFRASAELRKSELRADAERVKADVFQEGEARKADVQARVAEELALIQGEIATTRQAIQQEAALQKALGSLNIALGMTSVLTNTALKCQAITALGIKHKQAASDAVTSRQKAAREFGISEGKRGKEAIDGQANEAAQRGQAKAATYPDDERGQAQAEAVLKVAAEYYEKLKEPGPDLQENMEDAGNELADGLDGAEEKLVDEIDQQIPKVVEGLQAQSLELLSQFTTLQAELNQNLDDFVTDLNSQLDGVEVVATAELQALESNVASQIDQSVLEVASLIDSETELATTSVDSIVEKTVAGVESQKRISVESARKAIERGNRAIQTTTTSFSEVLAEATNAFCAELGNGAEAVGQGVATCGANVSENLGTVTASALDGLSRIGSAAKDSSDKIVEEWDKVLADAETSVDTQFTDAVTGLSSKMDEGLVPGKAKMTAQVDQAIEKNRAPLIELDGKMEEAAKEARDKYDAPWYEKVGRWVLSAIKAIFWAVVALLVIVILIIAAIVLIIVGIVADIVVLIVIGVILLVAVIGYVIYGIIKGIINRVKSAKTWYGAIWGVVVGILDITGIPGVIEGIAHRDIVNGRKLSEEEAGERFGTGLVAVILLLLPLKGKFGKAPKTPVEVPPPIEAPPLPKKPVEVPVPRELPKVPEKPTAPEIPPETPKVPEKPVEAPKVPEKPVETPKAPEKPAEPSKAPKEPAPAEAPKEPTTPKEVEKAKLEEAEATETAKRPKVSTLADLEKLKKDPPLKEKPPEGADPGMWSDYVDYWNERVRLLEEEIKSPAEPGAKPKTSPPLPWDAYSAFRGKFMRGRVFQDKVTEALTEERPDIRIEQDVGVKKGPAAGAAEGAKTTTKFADQLGVDKAKLEAWEKAGKPKDAVPDVETFSNKSREFAKMSEGDRAAQVAADVAEAIDKYGGEVEIRRPGHPLYGFKPKVSKVTLIYDAKLAPVEFRPAIEAAARDAAAKKGVPVEVKFMDVSATK